MTRTILITAIAPLSWGTTYLVTSELLPPGRPLLAAVLRALPAGLLLLAITRTLPRGAWWWKSAVLGALNIGVFFALLFIAAYRLPGGVAATMGAIQPLVVALLASRLVGEAITLRRIIAGVAGIGGVALLVLQAQARLDVIGVIAALGGTVSMALGAVLSKRWGRPASGLAVTSWQLIAGGVVLVPVLLLVEGLPTEPPTTTNLLGYAYLTLVGTALAYALWFRGIERLPVTSVSFLGLLSPVVAVLVGFIVLHQTLSIGQLVGVVVVLGALAVVFAARPVLSSSAEGSQSVGARR
ncbi:EamA family transporter [Plantibacter sp. Mn2098]|uniref:EamA family transporter n=1 Tax=Plantibacter sp. Mn2098 TaxID=3395266 RepID=UPI003BE4C826